MPYLDSMKETGSNTITPAEWRSRIEDRLSARVVHPQIPVRSEDGLETYLVNYYSDADPSEKLKIEEAVLDILLAARRKAEPEPWLGYLFHFVRLSNMEAVADQLVSLFLAETNRGNPLRHAPGAYQATQLHELMHAIRGLSPKAGPLSWGKYLDDPDLAQFAFYALVESDLDAALKAFPLILSHDESTFPISKHNCLSYLLGHWRSERLHSEPVAAILIHFSQNEMSVWAEPVRKLLREIPSARAYIEAYEMIEKEGVKHQVMDQGDIRTLVKSCERFMYIGIGQTWEVMDAIRNMIHGVSVFGCPVKDQAVYEFTYALFAPIAPPTFLKHRTVL